MVEEKSFKGGGKLNIGCMKNYPICCFLFDP
jgi:hypothetical protein